MAAAPNPTSAVVPAANPVATALVPAAIADFRPWNFDPARSIPALNSESCSLMVA